MNKTFLFFLIVVTASSCDVFFKKEGKNPSGTRIVKVYYSNHVLKSEVSVKDTIRHGITKNYDKNGKLTSVISYENNVKSGMCKGYYPSGKLHSSVNYEKGLKSGDEIWYYETGTAYRINPFVKGKINGIQRWYYKNGKLMGEVPHKNGKAGMGLKEYGEDGKLITSYPEISIQEIDQIMMANRFVLKISLSNHSGKVSFYMGELDEGKYFPDFLMEIPVEKGIATQEYNVPPGFMTMQKINIVARYRTQRGLPYITQKTYNLALQH